MFEPGDLLKLFIPKTDNPIIRRLPFFTYKISISQILLYWQRIWPSIVGILILLALLLIYMWVKIWAFIPEFLHYSFLLALLLIFIYRLYRLISIKFPKIEEALNWLESKDDNKELHHPLSGIRDELANSNDELTQELWKDYKLSLIEKYQKVSLRLPRSNMPYHDRFGLRFIVTIIFIVSFIYTDDEVFTRISDGFYYNIKGDAPLYLDLWVVPPKYTKKPPTFLANGVNLNAKQDGFAENSVFQRIPENSKLFGRLSGKGDVYIGHQANDSSSAFNNKTVEVKFEAQESNISTVESWFDVNQRFSLYYNDIELRSWLINIEEDKAPFIRLAEPFTMTANGNFRVKYEVKDDYGIARIFVRIEPLLDNDANSVNLSNSELLKRKIINETGFLSEDYDNFIDNGGDDLGRNENDDNDISQLPDILKDRKLKYKDFKLEADESEGNNKFTGVLAEFEYLEELKEGSFEIELKTPFSTDKETQLEDYIDLDIYNIVNNTIDVVLYAVDLGGNVGVSERYRMIVPEKPYQNMLAKALIEQRRKLIKFPENKWMVARNLSALNYAADYFKPPLVPYLGINHAISLLHSPGDELLITSEVSYLLQLIARQLEGVSFADSRKKVVDALDDLQKALDDNASQDELNKLVDNLNNAIDNLADQMVRNSIKNKGEDEKAFELLKEKLNSEYNINELKELIADILKNGTRSDMEVLVDKLRDIYENLVEETDSNLSELEENYLKQIQGLKKLIDRQYELNNENYSIRKDYGNDLRDFTKSEMEKNNTATDELKQRYYEVDKIIEKLAKLKKGQNELKNQLKDHNEKLSKVLGIISQNLPKNIQNAISAMENAVKSIESGDMIKVDEEQSQAIKELSQGSQELKENMAQLLQQLGDKIVIGKGFMDLIDLFSDDKKNFKDVHDFEKDNYQQSREIRDKLRELLGDYTRPQYERDYIQKLLEDF